NVDSKTAVKENMSSQKGNALFLILIAVALFAALSYAVTQSGRDAAGIEEEQELLDAGVAQQCEGAVNHAIKRVKTLNGCQPDQISYEIEGGINVNDDAPADESCHLFRENGGGATPCGAYEDPKTDTGQITMDDTETVAVTAGGTYLQCTDWSGSKCRMQYSLDGSDFTSVGEICTYKDGDGRGSSKFAQELFCAAACGGNPTDAKILLNDMDYYLEDDGSLTPMDQEECTGLFDIDCDCFE
ncbi:MAG: hypothetical protein ACQEQL_09025, partial [Pseudomonadota bacterium]